MVHGRDIDIQAGATDKDRIVRYAGVIAEIMDVCGGSAGRSACAGATKKALAAV